MSEHILTVVNLYVFLCLTKINITQIYTKSDFKDYSTRYNYQLVLKTLGLMKVKTGLMSWLLTVTWAHSISNKIFENFFKILAH